MRANVLFFQQSWIVQMLLSLQWMLYCLFLCVFVFFSFFNLSFKSDVTLFSFFVGLFVSTEKHPIEYAIDGTNRWWQSPSIKNGMEYHYVTITLDLKQVHTHTHTHQHTLIHMPDSSPRETWLQWWKTNQDTVTMETHLISPFCLSPCPLTSSVSAHCSLTQSRVRHASQKGPEVH